jgi:hypothetical protein
MVDPLLKVSNQRDQMVLQKIRELMGKIEPSSKLQGIVPGFKTQKGIYKPTDSPYALWIRHTARGIYADKDFTYLPDGSWTYKYMPEARRGIIDLSLSTNQSLIKCRDDKIPLGVFIQREIPGLQRSYQILGLAYVEDFDGTHFIIHGEAIDPEDPPMMSDRITSFEPFERNPNRMSPAMRMLREQAFQTAVHRVYHEKCSLCELGYRYQGQSFAVEAAHIIPVSKHGTSKDIRNGVLLCRNHHSLFDSNLWAFDEDYRILVNPDRQFRQSAVNNCVLKMEGKKLPNLPEAQYDLPAAEAIRFRLKEFFTLSG